ncbi:MAG TPA: NAD-dependent epimerase/dehydratase family protein [Nevskiaceae bacterium]|nr:NAD-dependent epimerase/dehydratase family protein [Nevskiaceae bacterium]
MKVLVTGGAGFIGSHLVERLLLGGVSVSVVDDFSSGREANLVGVAGHHSLQVLHKPVSALTVAELEPPAAIVHLASIPSAAQSWQSPLAAHEANLSSTVHLLDLAARWRCRTFVLASSAAVYGNAEVPVRETAACQPQSPYGLHKLASEEYLRLLAPRAGMQAVNLRLFNVYGPRQRADSEYAGVISRFAHAALANQPMRICGDGQQTRDFVHVDDVIESIMQSLEVSPAAADLRLNIGSGRAVSIDQLARMLARGAASTAGAVHIDAREGDIRHSCADISRAAQVLGYRPAVTLEQGTARLLDALRG